MYLNHIWWIFIELCNLIYCRSGTYIPSDSGSNNLATTSLNNPSVTSEEFSSLRTNSQYKHSYRNYKPYDPEEIKQQYRNNYGYLLNEAEWVIDIKNSTFYSELYIIPSLNV